MRSNSVQKRDRIKNAMCDKSVVNIAVSQGLAVTVY